MANGDSSMNEVERIQSYVGDAICDGAGLTWEYQTLDLEKTKDMTVLEFNESERKRMEFNASKVIFCHMHTRIKSRNITHWCLMNRY